MQSMLFCLLPRSCPKDYTGVNIPNIKSWACEKFGLCCGLHKASGDGGALISTTTWGGG